MPEYERDNYVYPGPRTAINGRVIGSGQGISVRDHFAGMALNGILANPELWDEITAGELARKAYELADAMMHVRLK